MNNKFSLIKSIFSVAAVALLLVNSCIFVTANSSFVISDTYNLSDNIAFSNEIIVDDSGSLHRAYVVDYSPSEDFSDIAFLNGDVLNTRTTVTKLVSSAETEFTPVAAMNADFFNMSTGLAESLVISGGNLLTSDRGNYAFAFDSDGVPFIGKPEINIGVTSPFYTGNIIHYNKEFTEYGLYLYSEYYSTKTLIDVPSVELVLLPFTEQLDYQQMALLIYGEEGVPFDLYISDRHDEDKELFLNERYREDIESYALDNGYIINNEMFYKKAEPEIKLGETVYAYVKEIRNNEEGNSLEIPEGCFILAANAKTQSFKFEKAALNDIVQITFNCNERFIGVNEAIGCGALIVDNGEVVEHNELSHYSSASPRTAIGITEDGRVIMLGVDGRQGAYSKGLTLKRLSQELIRLNCVYGANLDGGGSTVVKALLPYNDDFVTVNKPSDGAERKVSNAIAFYNTASPAGDVAYSYLISDNHLVLFNSSLRLGKPVFTDSSHYAVELSDTPVQVQKPADNTDIVVETDDEILNELLDYTASTEEKQEQAVNTGTEYDYHGFTYSVDSGKGFINKNVYTPDGYQGEVFVISTSPEGHTNNAFRIISLSEIDGITVDFEKPYLYVGDVADISAKAFFKGFEVTGTDDCFFWISDNERALEVSEYGEITAKTPTDKVTVTVAFGQTSKKIDIEVLELPFVDISGNWAKDNIIFLYEEGISNGELTEKGRMYFPSRSFTRNEFCVMLSRMLGLTIAVDTVETAEASDIAEFSETVVADDTLSVDVQNSEDTLTDGLNDSFAGQQAQEAAVQEISETAPAFADFDLIPSWAANAVSILHEGGYLAGFEHYSDAGMIFDGTGLVTRREVVRLVGNLLENAPDDYDFKYSDVKADDADYQCIKNALYHGIFNGYLDGTLRLDTTLTRAEVSAVFVRLMSKI